jgi:hypothetical protein
MGGTAYRGQEWDRVITRRVIIARHRITTSQRKPPPQYEPPPARYYEPPVAGLLEVGRDEPQYQPPSPGFRTWNNCPPLYTVQDGFCKPYKGR